MTPRVVIVGGGFGGLTAAKTFRGHDVEVTLIDRVNHHLFQPLLYQVATAGLAPSDIAVPIRWVLRNEKNVSVVLGDVVAVDAERHEVRLANRPANIAYDYLILAPGARHSYFHHPEWEPCAPGLKSLSDAMEIRRRFLLAFERAEQMDDPAEREALMTFVIIGGGPTGVELAGTMIEIVRRALPGDFRQIDTRLARVVLLEGGPRLLPAFPEAVGASARADLERLGVEVRTGALVSSVDPREVRVGDSSIPSRSVFWAAGNQASPLAATLGVPLDNSGRVLVEPDLSVSGQPDVFVVGDLAAVRRPDNSWVPAVAQAANQEGARAARNVLRRATGRGTTPFRYVNKGELAVIGRNRAIAVFGDLRFAGFGAWLLWLFVHILYLAGFRNRASVLVQWGYAYFTFQRGVRLIP